MVSHRTDQGLKQSLQSRSWPRRAAQLTELEAHSSAGIPGTVQGYFRDMSAAGVHGLHAAGDMRLAAGIR